MSYPLSSAPLKIETGLIEGNLEDGLMAFRGIPFAAPPIGELRWKPPSPHAPWEGVRETKEFAASNFQFGPAIPGLDGPDFNVSEDCLYLNIWTPAKSADEKLAVMVWIHGGGFSAGSPSFPGHSGEKLAKKGVIVVSIAYRLGIFGFMAHPDLTAESSQNSSGNYGILDQIAALDWIKHNIAVFGGDPDRVTIFGQSAGAISVSMLAASPLAKNLFHRAISQSGGSFAVPHSPPIPGENVQMLADSEQIGLAFSKEFDAENIADMRALSATQLHETFAGRMELAWPVFDNWVIPDHPYRLYSNGDYNDVPVLIGTNSDEGAPFFSEMSPAQHTADTKARYGDAAADILKHYPATDDQSALTAARQLIRDIIFGWHTWIWANLQSATGKSNVYFYYYDHASPRPADSPFINSGALHSDELPYVFDHFDTQALEWRKENYAMSETLMSYWSNFAKTGNPNGEGVPEWPAYTESNAITMHFNETAEIGTTANLDQLKAVHTYMLARLKSVGVHESRSG